MNQRSQPTSTQIRPILQFSANQSILSKSQRHPILRRKVARTTSFCCALIHGASRMSLLDKFTAYFCQQFRNSRRSCLNEERFRRGIRIDNPVRGVERFADGQRLRRLSEDEYGAAGRAIRLAGEIWLEAVAASRLLAVTGWRSGEVVGLKRTEVDLTRRTAILGDTKTGKSIRPLSHAACDILREQIGDGDLLFHASNGERSMTGFPKFWHKIAEFG